MTNPTSDAPKTIDDLADALGSDAQDAQQAFSLATLAGDTMRDVTPDLRTNTVMLAAAALFSLAANLSHIGNDPEELGVAFAASVRALTMGAVKMSAMTQLETAGNG